MRSSNWPWLVKFTENASIAILPLFVSSRKTRRTGRLSTREHLLADYARPRNDGNYFFVRRIISNKVISTAVLSTSSLVNKSPISAH